MRLLHVAVDLIQQVNSPALIIDHWTFGGGTAMMLQIDHRESRDVDIFLQDPQLLAFLNPEKRDFRFEVHPSDYTSDGANFVKLVFDHFGEIDFIVDLPKTTRPAIERVIVGENVLLETIPEIITKKIVHRGARIRPRDIFDIAAAGEQYGEEIIVALRPYKSSVTEAVKRIDMLNSEFVNNAISELLIHDKFRAIAAIAIARTREILQAV
jgi:hypothetical protein